MASYKVPQDVEAEDKLLGPFSFRQFIYLMIVAASIGIGYVLYRVFPPLLIIPLLVALFFGVLALPLRKDQPMEIYLVAILSFYLKPRKRLWEPDGIESLVQVATPRNEEENRTKNVSESEAEQRLRYLARIADTRGWAVRGVNEPVGTSLNADVFNEAQQTPDILDETGSIAQNLSSMMDQSAQRRHEQMLTQFKAAAAAPPQPVAPQPVTDSYAAISQQPAVQPFTQQPQAPQPAPQTYTAPAPQFNPYPASMNQRVIQPMSAQPAPAPQPPEPTVNTSANPVSPDIINLATNADLSVETIAREAHRITEKESKPDDEVIISLR